jgi:hypothetical protein
MKTLRINDSEVAIIAEDGSLNGGARISGAHIVFNQVADAKRVWELLTRDALEYREPEPAMHLADLEMLSKRIDELETTLDGAMRHDASSDRDLADELEQVKQEQQDLRQELESVQSMAMCEAEVNDLIEDAVENLEIPHDDHVHDLISDYIVDDGNGMLKRRVLEIVADKLRFS